MTADEYIDKLEAPLKEVVIQLRSIVKGTNQQFQEAIKWRVPTYSCNSNICAIIAHKNHVNLQVFQGAHIAVASMLTGSGKDMRHLSYASTSEIDQALIEEVLQQAVALDQR